MFPRVLPAAALALLASCSAGSGDPHAVVTPDPLGQGLRIRDIANPSLATHPKPVQNPVGGVLVNAPVTLTGATILWNDTFDETGDGKSRGTVYAQDIGPQDPPVPYSGVGIFSPAYVPADLRIAPGDVLDFAGPYEELASIGTAKFPAGQVLSQLSKPVGTFRFEYKVPDPAVINVADLSDYTKGRQWLGMLVTVQNVTAGPGGTDTSGRRVTYPLGNTTNAAAISNELYDLKQTAFPAGTQFKSVTGIVTWFFSYHIAPRTPADLVQ
jgi:hypothetical protein